MREGFRWCLMSESLSDAVREAAQGEAERKVAAVREECGWASDDAAWYRHGFAQGAVWVAGRLPSEAELTNAILGRTATSAAKEVLALIREHVTRG